MGTTKMIRLEHANDFELSVEPLKLDDKVHHLTLGAKCDAVRADAVACYGDEDKRLKKGFTCASPSVLVPSDVWAEFKKQNKALQHFVDTRQIYEGAA